MLTEICIKFIKKLIWFIITTTQLNQVHMAPKFSLEKKKINMVELNL